MKAESLHGRSVLFFKVRICKEYYIIYISAVFSKSTARVQVETKPGYIYSAKEHKFKIYLQTIWYSISLLSEADASMTTILFFSSPGIGYAGVLVMQYINIYYTVILGWALFYMFASFQSRLPWSHCGNEWNTPNCVDYSEKSTQSGMHTNHSIANTTMLVNTTLENANKVSASQEYWE